MDLLGKITPCRSRRLVPNLNNNNNECAKNKRKASDNNDAILVLGLMQPITTTAWFEMGQQSGRRRRRNKQTNLPAAVSAEIIPIAGASLAPPTICAECGAKKFQFETPHFCCGNGEVKVATNALHPTLEHLFTSQDADALHFQTYCRLYNNMFAFSSLGGSIDCKTHKGIYVFKLHGQIYHYFPNLIPKNDTPKFLQLYFYDAQHENDLRSNLFKELRPSIISILMDVMRTNPYASFFKSLREKHVDEHTTILINKNSVPDQRVYNAPTADEVAVLWSDVSELSECNGPYIVVTGKNDAMHRIRHYYGCYDPLQYPLLFPFGESGWRPGSKRTSPATECEQNHVAPVATATDAEGLLAHEHRSASQRKKKKDKEVSCREYYAYLLQIRPGNLLVLTGRLLLQFIVDIYVKLENSRLDFLRNNQPTIRADLYQGILDTVLMGSQRGANVGHRIILPPSFIGGPWDMRRWYLNAMALVQKFRKPDLFITITCNPNWPEIKQELREGEKPQNRPDLIARIFHAKLLTAKKEIMENKVFGEVAALIYVVEFQKRGLPHAHFLIILKPSHKIKSVEDFDKYVSAEIPTAQRPHLRKIVLNHMMHGPCGAANPRCPCMKEKKGTKFCKSGYPKPYSSFTTNNEDGYPMYRRKDTGEVLTIRGHQMDNRWVIPYNPYLLALLDCHCNVEICSTIQAVKYLYKYVYKGHDKISFNVSNPDKSQPFDEIDHFQSGRWVSAPEAAWRIFAFDLYEMYPPVLPLQVHTENMQSIQFHAHENLSSIVSDSSRSRTPLTEFFKLNQLRPNSQKLLYAEFPEHFVWDSREKKWKDRKRGVMIGRLTFASPSEGDRFFLRILLAHICGPKSFDDLLTVNGHTCAGYQEACLRLGLIEQSDMAEQCLAEAVAVQMPHSLRRLFATILIFCHPPHPKELWEKFYPSLSEDFTHSFPGLPNKAFTLTVQKIEELLEGMGKNLESFNLGHLKLAEVNGFRITRDIEDAMNAPLPLQYIEARKRLNPKQREAYKSIMHHVKSNSSAVFFIDGPGGTGKTFLYCALYAKVRQMDKIVLPTATSGIAVAGLPNGRTAHSRFKLPLDHTASLTCDVPKQGSLAALLKETTLIIWDEAPMAHKSCIHALDLLLCDVCNPNIPFGGKIVIFGGDFRQVLPVVPHKTQKEAVDASLVSSSLWPNFIRYHLEENMRAKEDPAFANFLLTLGDGKLQHTEHGSIELPPQISTTFVQGPDNITEVINSLFPMNNSLPMDAEAFANQAILTPKNDAVDAINEGFIQRFPGESVVYKSFDTLLDDNCNVYPTEFLHTLCPGGMSPHELILKKDCPVMLLRNIDPSSGLCNGTRLTCKKFFPNMLLCEISTGFYKGQEVMLPRVNLRPSSSSNFPFQFQRKQFPIKLSFAMTINKSQGQTLNNVGIYLHQPCFSHGQLYVALSRARKARNVKVMVHHTLDEQHTCVKNIVSFDILAKAGII